MDDGFEPPAKRSRREYTNQSILDAVSNAILLNDTETLTMLQNYSAKKRDKINKFINIISAYSLGSANNSLGPANNSLGPANNSLGPGSATTALNTLYIYSTFSTELLKNKPADFSKYMWNIPTVKLSSLAAENIILSNARNLGLIIDDDFVIEHCNESPVVRHLQDLIL